MPPIKSIDLAEHNLHFHCLMPQAATATHNHFLCSLVAPVQVMVRSGWWTPPTLPSSPAPTLNPVIMVESLPSPTPTSSEQCSLDPPDFSMSTAVDLEKDLTHACVQAPKTFKQQAIFFSVLFCIFLAFLYLLCTLFNITTVLSFELVCKTTDAYKLQQDFINLDASSSHKSLALANYLLQLPTQYFSARTSSKVLYSSWRTSYESLAMQATQDFIQMNLKSTVPQDNEQYIMVKLLVVVMGCSHNFPNVKTLDDVLRLLRTIKAISHLNFNAEDLFWTHPFNNVADLPSLNLIIQPQLQQPVYPTTTVAAY